MSLFQGGWGTICSSENTGGRTRGGKRDQLGLEKKDPPPPPLLGWMQPLEKVVTALKPWKNHAKKKWDGRERGGNVN